MQERGEECNQAGTCQSESDSDGRLIWNSERTLRTSKDSGEDKIDRDHADLLRYPYSKCGQPYKTRVCTSCPRGLMSRVERNFTGVVVPDVTENGKIGPETEPMI